MSVIESSILTVPGELPRLQSDGAKVRRSTWAERYRRDEFNRLDMPA